MINSSIKESVAYKNLVLARALGSYSKAELVLYSTSISDIPIKYDSYMYKIIESKPENTPYYYIYCHLLERYN